MYSSPLIHFLPFNFSVLPSSFLLFPLPPIYHTNVSSFFPFLPLYSFSFYFSLLLSFFPCSSSPLVVLCLSSLHFAVFSLFFPLRCILSLLSSYSLFSPFIIRIQSSYFLLSPFSSSLPFFFFFFWLDLPFTLSSVSFSLLPFLSLCSLSLSSSPFTFPPLFLLSFLPSSLPLPSLFPFLLSPLLSFLPSSLPLPLFFPFLLSPFSPFSPLPFLSPHYFHSSYPHFYLFSLLPFLFPYSFHSSYSLFSPFTFRIPLSTRRNALVSLFPFVIVRELLFPLFPKGATPLSLSILRPTLSSSPFAPHPLPLASPHFLLDPSFPTLSPSPSSPNTPPPLLPTITPPPSSLSHSIPPFPLLPTYTASPPSSPSLFITPPHPNTPFPLSHPIAPPAPPPPPTSSYSPQYPFPPPAPP
ncbi:hypothetical protein C7M84_018963 [Penaeus vannamei]|uniref:Uncharacterized protein n=1 Tax=Penaeus vannamei TaxID=6689 RepID=A0A423SG45_PENVA|nr:hypothetical protein C7M84_018963 [Penaeus vannamei]